MPPTTNTKATAWTSATASLSILAISVGLSLFIAAYERAIDPLFGSIASAKHVDSVVYGCTALGIVLPKPPRSSLLLALAILVQTASHTSYWVGVFAARNGGPVLGPLVSHVVVLAPVIYLAVSLAASVNLVLASLALAVNALRLRPLILLFTHYFSLDIRKDVLFLTLGSLTLVFWIVEKFSAPRSLHRTSTLHAAGIAKKIFVAVTLVALFLFSVLYPPTLSSSGIFPHQSQNYPLRILSSKDSVTGVVVVGELLPREVADSNVLHSIRYLRASHSLLGGVWIGPSVASLDSIPFRTDQGGTPLGDSIYHAFVLQEAVRLASNRPQGDRRQHALVIGLGAGISADALVRHGISTTIVEIDPAVYEAAREFFGLEYPGDGHVFLEDARNWVRGRKLAVQAADKKSPTFDMVIHDCFSGGGVPQHLFSVEFWNDLKLIMKPDGVIGVNFAGRFGSHSTRAVFTTLKTVFGQCRVFHDLSTQIPEDQPYSDFLNMVFFCSLSSYPLTFRPAMDADYLHSYLRRYVLSDLDRREVSIPQLVGGDLSRDTEESFVLTDANNTLDAWQNEEALEHWKVMRKILPDVLWETY